jgi:hypothetical protein
MTKKGALILIILIFILLLGGLFSYYFFFVKPNSPVAPGETRSFSDFFPFGKSEDKKTTPEPTDEGTGGADPEAQQPIIAVPKLRQVSKEPVAGATVFDRMVEISTDGIKEKFNKTYIRYVDRATGHISEAVTDSLNVRRLSNTTMPKIYEALWGNRDTMLLRYLADDDTIRTYYARLFEATTTDQTKLPPLDGQFLAERIPAVVFSPKKDKIFYFSGGSTAMGIISNPNGQTRTEIYSSPFSEWLPEWPTDSIISLTTKATASLNGHSYFVNSKSGAVTKVLSDIRGLTTKVNPTGTYLLYGEGGRQHFLYTYDIQKKTATIVKGSTLPEKCVWSIADPKQAYCAIPDSFPAGEYPDDWYKGRVSFTDKIVKVDATSGTVTEIFNITDTGKTTVDAIDLHLNTKEDTLIFTNKKDYTLWSLNLSKE